MTLLWLHLTPACRPCRWVGPRKNGADDRTRTGDLVLTKDALYLLSYIGPPSRSPAAHERYGGQARPTCPPLDPTREPLSRPGPTRIVAFRPATPGLPAEARLVTPQHPRCLFGGRRLERETGIEPATNSLEGCDSTTELLPPSRSCPSLRRASPRLATPVRPSRSSCGEPSPSAPAPTQRLGWLACQP